MVQWILSSHVMHSFSQKLQWIQTSFRIKKNARTKNNRILPEYDILSNQIDNNLHKRRWSLAAIAWRQSANKLALN